MTNSVNRLEADTYTGRHTMRSNQRSDVFTARELAAMSNGEIIVLWEFHGHTRSGAKLFGRHRFVGQPDGSIAGFDSNGICKIIHPADRSVRVLTN